MGFWGIEVKPGKPYTYQFKNVFEKLHVTQATLGDGSSTKKSAIQCSVGEKTPVLLCSFLPEKIETCPLNLEFEGSDAVTFSVVGPRSVHLSGFLKANDRDYMEDDGDQDSYSSGEDIAVTDSDDSSDYGSEDDYEDDFIDDDGFGFPPSPVPNSGVVIEEIVEDEKPVHENSRSKQTKKKKQVGEPTENKNSQQQLVAKSGPAALILESEDEDGFPITSTKKIKPDVEKPNSDAGEKMAQKATTETKKKRRRDGSDHFDNSEEKDGSMEDTKSVVVTENNIKKKNKKQKQQSEEGNAKEVEDALPVKIEEDLKTNNDKNMDVDSVEKKKKKNKKKSKAQESGDGVDAGKSVTPAAVLEEKKAKTKASQVRTFPNGLIIEELAMGKPDGKRASPGNKVSVHYIGKLKKDGSIFDSNIGRAPFKFRLGVGQVIKGWDVGVNGMRIGDKRRLTIPPSMGYGAKGAGKQIPPNSWLMFDVELVDAR